MPTRAPVRPRLVRNTDRSRNLSRTAPACRAPAPAVPTTPAATWISEGRRLRLRRDRELAPQRAHQDCAEHGGVAIDQPIRHRGMAVREVALHVFVERA